MSERFDAERIGGVLFCRWRSDPSEKPTAVGFSHWFPVSIALAFLFALGLGRLALNASERGSYAEVRAFGFALMAWLYVGPLIMVVTEHRKRAAPPTDAPSSVPVRAVYGRAVLSRDGRNSLAGTGGWLWVDGPWLQFEGEHFSFRLAARDFRFQKQLARDIAKQTSKRLVTPVGIRPQFLMVRISRSATGPGIQDRREQLQRELEPWAICDPPSEGSLFPPLRRRSTSTFSGRSKLWFIAGTAVAVICGSCIPLVFADSELGHRTWWSFALPIAALLLMMPAIQWTEAKSIETENRRIDRLVDPEPPT
jgi:hypothetical protein